MEFQLLLPALRSSRTALQEVKMGGRWGWEGPPPEAYSRVTNPERFRPLHGFAEQLLGSLETDFAVTREDGSALDSKLMVAPPGSRTERLVPRPDASGALTVAFTPFPGLFVQLGHWWVEPIPPCGCDACDETAEEGQARLEWLVGSLTKGRFRESIRLGLWGDGWLTHELSETWGRAEHGESRTSDPRRGP